MSKRAEILKKLYAAGRITEEGVRKAADDGVITEEEYAAIADTEEDEQEEAPA